MFSYILYGLGVSSDFPFPELMRQGGFPDVHIRYGKLEPPEALLPDSTGGLYYVTNEEVYLYWEGEAAYLVRRGKEIIVDPAPGVEEQLVRLTLLGPVLAVLLHQRGLIVLHASGVTTKSGAVIFLGDCGWGKSTLAAAMYARGHGVIADDLIAVNNDGPEPVALAGFPQLKIWPDAVGHLGLSPDLLYRISADEEKHGFRAEKNFCQNPLPLHRIYVLSEGLSQRIESLSAKDALMALVQHSYRISLMHPIKGASYLIQCSSLVQQMPVFRLSIAPSRSLDDLPRLIRLIEEDLDESHGLRAGGKTAAI